MDKIDKAFEKLINSIIGLGVGFAMLFSFFYFGEKLIKRGVNGYVICIGFFVVCIILAKVISAGKRFYLTMTDDGSHWEKHEKLLKMCKEKEEEYRENNNEDYTNRLRKIIESLDRADVKKTNRMFMLSSLNASCEFLNMLGLIDIPNLNKTSDIEQSKIDKAVKLIKEYIEEEVYYCRLYGQNPL